MHVEPITCYRPRPEAAATLASPPYDVFDRAGAEAYLAAHPGSFLSVERPDAASSPAAGPDAPDDVYQVAHDRLADLVNGGSLLRDGTPCFYLYRLEADGRSQTGVVAACSLDDYSNGIIRRHELTRPKKEDDRVRHIEATGCQTAPVVLAYPDNPVLDALVEAAKTAEPLYDFVDADGVRQTVWRVARPAAVESLRLMFEHVPCAYVADGHHRAAAAARVCRRMRTEGGERHTGDEAYNYLLCALFPASRLHADPYDRVVADVAGMTEDELVAALEAQGVSVGPRGERPVRPSRRGAVGMYAFGAWRELGLPDERPDDPADALDVSVLQDRVLAGVLGVGDPREDPRLSFVGGAAEAGELERRAGDRGVAFTLFPTSVAELMAVADAGRLMPPKSTWFAPKPSSGLFVRRVSNRECVLDGRRRHRGERDDES
ncbi:DUF1015 domain-containing protein [Thermophilibacter mediterraneus]|uniref:DUF1015 domain-containing protein n=1 Tax=Thermophilibacter mediterraneus TaxID=1871031 RepID=UPI00092FEB72|nr:DUF1015 domain-containing protein [Thermophilibacter mediterraneus]